MDAMPKAALWQYDARGIDWVAALTTATDRLLDTKEPT